MNFSTRFAALCAAGLLCAAAAGQQPSLPSDQLFAEPNFSEALSARIAPGGSTAPVSAVDGVMVGAPAPTYRTLQEAAQAGINPLGSNSQQPVRIESDSPPAPRPMWPAVFGGLALVGCAFVLFVLMLSFIRTPQVPDVDE